MKRNYWLGAAMGVVAMGLVAGSSQAAPLNAGASEVKAVAGDASAAQNVHWNRRYYRGYYYGPRPYYGYGYDRPYRYYGYGPGFGFYAGPRYYRRGWW